VSSMGDADDGGGFGADYLGDSKVQKIGSN